MDLNKKTIVFIDLDGTLIETVSGKTFPEDCTDFRIRKDVVDRLRKMENLCYIVIVTNQGGVPKYTSMEDFYAKANGICAFLTAALNPDRNEINVDVDCIACYSNDESDPNRKPNTGMLQSFVDQKLQYATARLKSKANMVMIGDASGGEDDFSDTDKKCAENFSIDYLDVEDFVNQ